MPMQKIDTNHTLFLLPLGLSSVDSQWFLPENVRLKYFETTCFIAENAKTLRYFLKSIHHPIHLSEIEILELDKHNIGSQKEDIKTILLQNEIVGLVSEAGMPCIADPGSLVVSLAHLLDISVKPFVGPSSILLALIASGMNGQQFKFNGYLPHQNDERKKTILKLEIESKYTTQLLIETPYRNDKLLSELCATLQPNTLLLLAIDLTGENERVISKPIHWFNKNTIEIGKLPCIFGIGQ